jgi:hypothetical protein
MRNRYWLAVLSVVLVGLVFDYLIYWLFLGGQLEIDPSMRTPMQGPWPKLIIGELIFGLAFVWIYQKGLEQGSGLVQGLRFGFATAFLYAVAGGLQIAPMLMANETIIIGGIVANAIKVLTQGVAAGMTAAPAARV